MSWIFGDVKKQTNKQETEANSPLIPDYYSDWMFL